MYKYFLGTSYLINRPINLLGTIGVTVAVWALILFVNVFSGFIREVRVHIRAAAPSLVLLDDSLTQSYDDVHARVLRDDPDIAACAPRLVWHGLLYPEASRERGHYVEAGELDERTTNYFQIVGIDYPREREVSEIAEWLAAVDEHDRSEDPEHPFAAPPTTPRDGELPQRLPGIILGRMRARLQTVQTIRGDEVVLASARRLPDGRVEAFKQRFVTAGTFYTRHAVVEGTTAFVDIRELRSFFGHDEHDEDALDIFNEISIRLADESRAAAAKERLNRKLRDAGLSGAVFTWEDRQERFLAAVEHERGLMKVVLFVLMLVASFLIFTIVSMMVTRKTRDIGVVSALGGTRRGILAIFLISGTVIGIIGAALGIVTGYLSTIYLNAFNVWLRQETGLEIFPREIYGLSEIPYDLSGEWMIQVAVGALVIAVLFSFLPALRAARQDPVQALRYE